MIVYQVINHDREEMLFGRTELHIEKEMERLAKEPKGPVAHWKKGEVVTWRPLTPLMEPDTAKQFHKDLEAKPKPNKFKIIATFKE